MQTLHKPTAEKRQVRARTAADHHDGDVGVSSMSSVSLYDAHLCNELYNHARWVQAQTFWRGEDNICENEVS